MTDEEKEFLIDQIFDSDVVLSMIQDRYTRYKQEESDFYVPVTATFIDDKLALDVGDKSYNTREELEIAVEAWSEGKVKDISPFVDFIWDNKYEDIKVLVLVETEEYCFGAIDIIENSVVCDIKITTNCPIKNLQ